MGDYCTGVLTTEGHEAAGIIVQSLGGGGGNGGLNVSGGISAATKGSGSVALGVGGFGGLGGHAGDVSGTVASNVITFGNESSGLVYQSIGGGGGNGGANVSGTVNLNNFLNNGAVAASVGIGIGGFGGSGGNAAGTSLNFSGSVLTYGEKSYGILAQSLGGGGGHGGFDIAGAVNVSNGTSGTSAIGVGGFGGGGGHAGTINTGLTGNVTTIGNGAAGAVIQSFGGGGGAGGFNVDGTVSFAMGTRPSARAAIGLGGFGGGGGVGRFVVASINGDYITQGDDADAIVAHSIGGGGGHGGVNVSGGINFNHAYYGLGSATSPSAFVGLGGHGGAGGNASFVTFDYTGDISTTGQYSDGISLQSIGGGGGRGRLNVTGGITAATTGSGATLGFGMGGFGGGGGHAGDINAIVNGNVLATGFGSSGIIAQSIGGRGGSGGVNITGGVTVGHGGASGHSLMFGLGGFGGTSGDAGHVNLAIRSGSSGLYNISGNGDFQSAVAAQSIGGGGGHGGINVTGGILVTGGASPGGGIFAGVGGRGGAGGLARSVTVDIGANLFASGAFARGLVAQSIGGGGGNGGMNITGNLVMGDAQTFTFGMGGAGGTGSRASTVSVSHDGQIWTNGANSFGLLAQSIGGGGGSGGMNFTLGANFTGTGYSGVFAIGGTGGAGADGANVSVVQTGNIIMNGQNIVDPISGAVSLVPVEGATTGVGLRARSIGGGGGDAGINISGNVNIKGQPSSITVGGSGGASGSGGDVTVTRGYLDPLGARTAAPGIIQTFGDKSTAFHAESIGGGGGDAAFNLGVGLSVTSFSNFGTQPTTLNMAIGGNGGAAGHGGTVTVDHLGTLITQGHHSHGLLAKSIGGGGGDAHFNLGLGLMKDANNIDLTIGGDPTNAGNAGNVSVAHDGYIETGGDLSVGLFAQSIGFGGGNALIDTVIPYLSSVSVQKSFGSANSINVALGRRGGTGGTAGSVTVDMSGQIHTRGAKAGGIIAESIGGGGGRSTASGAGISIGQPGDPAPGEERAYQGSMSIGRQGGTGGNGGNVSVSAQGWITTQGIQARGIEATSIGGGGGTGGDALGVSTRANFEMTWAIGGRGGSGGQAGNVNVQSLADISTMGDEAEGIFARSIGGGGGEGGGATTFSLPGFGLKDRSQRSQTVNINIGGNGGAAALGGDISIGNGGIILTAGQNAAAIRAESIGGGGGRGGQVFNTLIGGGHDYNLSTNLGGIGTDGGYGGNVTVTNNGVIETSGIDSFGIFARSIGGGGGDGGYIVDTSSEIGGEGDSVRAVFNIGGNGGSGGIGGQVSVTNRTDGVSPFSGRVFTRGAGAHGIYAESIGGGGGNGGATSTVNRMSGSASRIVGLSIGGSGDTGGAGGQVDVDNQGHIETLGDAAHGIYAKSQGGGGGNGAIALSIDATDGGRLSTETVNPLVSIGGLGGDGGIGGRVTVTNSGTIVTQGKDSHGILAQSVGGGGGNASLGVTLSLDVSSLVLANAVSALIGAKGGGKGGKGGEVIINQTGNITVLGEGAQAVVAESINGGGGGLVVDLDKIRSTLKNTIPGLHLLGRTTSQVRRTAAVAPGDPLIEFRLGASDTSDMAASNASMFTSGNFGAAGNFSAGASIASIGGGGGNSFFKTTLGSDYDSATPDEYDAPVNLSFALGGELGLNNTGATATINHAGNLVTNGAFAPGLLMQSIGGGGGRSALDLTAPEYTFAGQLNFSLGAENGDGNYAGGAVSSVSGAIATTGDFAPGVIAQSIGGGGGLARARLDLTHLNFVDQAISLGSISELGGYAGDLSFDLSGGITTLGARSIGLLAQSVGAGGGLFQSSGAPSAEVTLGGDGASSGAGGNLNINNVGVVQTIGDGAHGVLLQSIGGGGGVISTDATSVTFSVRSNNTGNGGGLVFNQSGNIMTFGAGANGLILQSLGGGGGWVDGTFADTAGGIGRGGSIDFSVSGSVFAAAENSTAVFAQSSGSLGGGNILGTLTDMIRGGSGSGYGLWVDGGLSNAVSSAGSISAVSGQAIGASYGDDYILNTGLVIGNVDLGAGANAFDNAADASFVAFNTIDLRDDPLTPAVVSIEKVEKRFGQDGFEASFKNGKDWYHFSSTSTTNGSDWKLTDNASSEAPREIAALVSGSEGTFTNSGNFLMGLSASRFPIDLASGETFDNLDAMGDPGTNLLFGARVINNVELDGHFVQTPTGHLEFDVAFGPYASDIVHVSGDTTVDGTGEITLTWLENVDPVTLFETTGIAIDNGLEIADTMAIDFSIEANDIGIQLLIETDFAQNFLNRNGRELGKHMDSAVALGGSSGIGRLMALLGNLREGEEEVYSAIFAELNPEMHLASRHLQYHASRGFSGALFDCGSKLDRVDGQCVWSRLEMGNATRSENFEHFAAETENVTFRGGVELEKDNHWSVVAGIGYDHIGDIRVDHTRARADGQGLHGGLGLRWASPSGTEAGGSLSGGWQWSDMSRHQAIFGADTVKSDTMSGYLQTGFHLAHLARSETFFVRPSLNLTGTLLHHGEFKEASTEGLGMHGLSETEALLTFNPELMIGAVLHESKEARTELSVTGGTVHHSSGRLMQPMRFVGANPSSTPARIATALSNETSTLDARFRYTRKDNVDIQVGYRIENGDAVIRQSGGVDVRIRF